jgi:transposase
MRTKSYDKEFKLNVMKLYREGNRSAAQICEEYGVPESTFSGWITQYKKHGADGFPGSGQVKDSEKDALRLKRELEDVRLERDILKKALAIFSQQK